MRDWGDKLDLIDRMVKARQDARDTVPRAGGNDALEAAMFIAQWKAVREFLLARVETKGETGSAADVASAPAEAPAPAPEPVKEDTFAGLGGPFPTELLPEVNYETND